MKTKRQRDGISNVDFYFEDWLSGTLELSCEERGAYITLCALFWSKQGKVPDNDRWLAGMCNLSTRRWRAVKATLVERGKIEIISGFIQNNRAEIELENALSAKEMAKKKGRIGGEKKAENSAKTLANQRPVSSPATAGHVASEVAEGVAHGLPPLPLPLNTTLAAASVPVAATGAAAAEAPTDVGQVVLAFDEARRRHFGAEQGRMWPRSTDSVHAQRWLDAGATVAICAAVFEDICGRLAGRNQQPPGGLSYFDDAIRVAVAKAQSGPGDTSAPSHDWTTEEAEHVSRNLMPIMLKAGLKPSQLRAETAKRLPDHSPEEVRQVIEKLHKSNAA